MQINPPVSLMGESQDTAYGQMFIKQHIKKLN